MHHFTNGTSVSDTLAEAGVPGRVVNCADPLHEGPCLAVSPSEFDRTRAQYLARVGYTTLDEAEREFAARDRAIADAASDDEVVLWFEHDLFDQLNLVWLLTRLQDRAVPLGAVRLIVIGAHPEVHPFHGLGQLTASQLAALLPSREPLTTGAMSYASEAWHAVCASTPEGVARLAAHTNAPLPFLPGALARLLEELPGSQDGLSRVERQGLAAIAGGADSLGTAFRTTSDLEERVFLGDASFYRAITALADARAPLVTLDRAEGQAPREAAVRATEAGRAVLAGDADHARLNGLDRWVGGVRVEGPAPRWRWDPRGGRPVDGWAARA